MKVLRWPLFTTIALSLSNIGPKRAAAAFTFPGRNQLINPITSGSVTDIMERVVNWILLLAGMLAVVYLIYGGVVYITAAGNEDKVKQGKSILINAIIGMVIIILSYVIVSWVGSILRRGTTGF